LPTFCFLTCVQLTVYNTTSSLAIANRSRVAAHTTVLK